MFNVNAYFVYCIIWFHLSLLWCTLRLKIFRRQRCQEVKIASWRVVAICWSSHKLQVEELLTLHCHHATHTSEDWKDLEKTLEILSYHTCLHLKTSCRVFSPYLVSDLDFTNLAGSLFTIFKIYTYTHHQKYCVTIIHFNSMMEEDREECPVSSCVSLKSDMSKLDPINFRDEPGPPNPKYR